MPESLFTWLAVALGLFWFVGAHNRLVRLRSAVMQAFGGLDAALQRQLEFIQARHTGAAEPVSGAQASLLAAVGQFAAVLAATRQRPLDPVAMSALSTALHVVLASWQRLYPDDVTSFHADGTLARGDTQAGALTPAPLAPRPTPPAQATPPLGWPEPSAAAEMARGQFNQAVSAYNAAIAQFPAVLVAWAFRLRGGTLLQ